MKKLVLCIAAVVAIGMTSCRQTTDSKDSSGTSEQPSTPSTPAVPSNPDELVENDVLAAFGLTKGRQSPFEAAGKITSGSSAGSTIVFTQKEVTDYDDEAGTFTVKVKGTKNEKPFEKEITVAGFTNPYAINPQSMDATDNKGELKLDEGIEHNYSIEKYVEKANANITSFFKAPLTFSLGNGTSITIGNYPSYTLAATLAKEGTNKVKIVPVYTVKNHKKIPGGTDTIKEEQKYSIFPSGTFAANLTKPYFTEQDVFAHVLSKTPDSVIKAYSDEFASSFYAFTKSTESAPANLFDAAAIPSWAALYQTKDTDEYMKLDIDYGIANPKNGGIDADDYKGELTVQFCVAKQEDLADQSKDKPTRKIVRSGYAKIPDNAALKAKEHLYFHLVQKSPPLSSTDKTNWENKEINQALLRLNGSGAAEVTKPFDGSSSLFHLCVNSDNPNPAVYLGSAGTNYPGASKTRNGKVILIEHIQLKKAKNQKVLEVQVQLHGSGPVLTVTADPGY